jgi:hypothetical protein
LNDFSIVELRRYLFRGFATRNWVLPSYIVIDQKALAGGNWPWGKSSV